MTDSLLPISADAGERAVEAAIRRDGPDAEVLRKLQAPGSIPAAALPWLAWAEDVPVWPGGDRQRRDITARSLVLHGRIGTAAGLATGARLGGGSLRTIAMPPGKTFLGWWDEASRRAWLGAMPQLRVYPRRARAAAQGFMLGDGALSESPVLTDAVLRSTARATLWRDGMETELTVAEWRIGTESGNGVLALARRSESGSLHCGQPLAGQVARLSAGNRVWQIDQASYRYKTATLSVRTLSPSFAPLSADVELVAERAQRLGMVCLGRDAHAGAAYPARGDALVRYYRRSYLHDPAVVAVAKKGPAYLGGTRLGLAPFHVETRIMAPKCYSSSAHVRSACPMPLAARGPGQRLAPCLDAMDWFRAAADQVLVDTRNYQVARAGQTQKAGTVVAGQINQR